MFSRRHASRFVVLVLGVCALSAPPSATASGAWTPTEPLVAQEGRVSFTDTLLAGGQVLLAGGVGNSRPPEEVYHPLTNTWRRTGSLATPRRGHTATLITGTGCADSCGKVLVAGGMRTDVRSPALTVELYDPEAIDPVTGATGAWTPTSPMNTPRSEHTATLLNGPNCGQNCGKVLVVGGVDATTQLFFLTSAELYDPDTGSWTETAPLKVGRHGHTATLLNDGRVLVVGGNSQSGPTVSAEIYDPAEGKWSDAGSTSIPRLFHTATALDDGGVLVAGGLGGASASAETYDPQHGWRPTADMPAAATAATAARVRSGRVLVTSGDVAQLYDPVTRTWSETTPPDLGGTNATTLQDGTVLLTAGRNAAGQLVGEIFDELDVRSPPTVTEVNPKTGPTTGGTPVTVRGTGLGGATAVKFGDSSVAPLRTSGGQLTAIAPPHAAADVTVTVTNEGGSSPTKDEATFSYLTPRGGAFGSTSALAHARSRHTATRLKDGRVLVAGGEGGDGAALASAELYDPATGSWSATDPLKTPRYSHAAALLPSGKVLVVGGRQTAASNAPGLISAEVYDPATGKWSPTGSLGIARREGLTATVLPSGPASVCGGNCGKVLVVGVDRTAELYDPDGSDPATGRQGRWQVTGASGVTSRMFHSATLLSNGKVLVAGGTNGPADAGSLRVRASDSTELYDPASGSWTPGEPLTSEHAQHPATLLEGPGCYPRCGYVLIAGGETNPWVSGDVLTDASEVFDTAVRGRWTRTEPLHVHRLRHTATLLPSGKVLAAGGLAGLFPERDRLGMAELYDPQANSWSYTNSLNTPRELHTATLLGEPGCAPRCGRVLIAGGVGDDGRALSASELYTAAPQIASVLPSSGPSSGGTTVTLTGTGFTGVTGVEFGEVAATRYTVASDTSITAVTPAHGAGSVPVVVRGDGGPSEPAAAAHFSYQSATGGLLGDGLPSVGGGLLSGATRRAAVDAAALASEARRAKGLRGCLAAVARETGVGRRVSARERAAARRRAAAGRRRCLGLYARVPGRVTGLTARVVSGSKIVLSFLAPGTDGSRPPAARSYLIRLSSRAIRGARGFRRAQTLCGGKCRFNLVRVETRVSLTITGLRPHTRYFFAVAARDNVSSRVGPVTFGDRGYTTGSGS